MEIMGEYNRSRDREFFSTGLDTEYAFRKLSKKSSINMGVLFNVYQYDYYVESAVSQLVQNYYFNCHLKIREAYSVRIGYEFENNIEPYHSLKMGMRFDL